MKKKILLFFMLVCITVFSLAAPTASAETYGDLTYEINGGEITITDCDRSATSVVIPVYIRTRPVTKIDDYAFVGCGSLVSVTIPDSVTSIGEMAFSGCTGLTSIAIPAAVTSIGNRAFSGCTDLTKIDVDTNNNYYSSPDGNLYNKDKTTLIQYSIGKTESRFFIPNSVTSIGNRAFYECSDLTNITVPNSVTSIGNEAFYCCYRLISITIPRSVTNIGDYVFEGCISLLIITVDADNNYYSSLNGDLYNKDQTALIKYAEGHGSRTFVIPNSVTHIGNHAFYRCSRLESITISDSVTSIGDYAFWVCSRLENITVPDSVASIGEYAFYGTAYYENGSNWENGVLYIGNHLIKAKSGLSGEYLIKSGIKVIAGGAFSYCRNLTGITIPDSVTSIANGTFQGCSSLTSVTIPDSVTSIGDYAFDGCFGLTSIAIPDSVTGIGERAFRECFGLTNIAIPDSVTIIGDFAFEDCTSLTSITIPNSVTSIGDYAFSECSSLSTVYYNGTEKTWNNIQIEYGNDYLANAERKYFMYVTLIGKDGSEISRKKIYASLADTENGNIILALYDGDKLVETQSKAYDSKVSFTADKPYTSAKIMVWESLATAKPVCNAETVE